MNEPATSGRFSPCQSHRSWATLGNHQPDLVRTMPISVSTDPIRPAERQAFWTEAICRSFANVETKPLGSTVVSGHFEFVEIGGAKLVRFDSSPQCYTRDARLVSMAGSDEFMFDFQRRGRQRDGTGRKRGHDRSGIWRALRCTASVRGSAVRSRAACGIADRHRARRVAVAVRPRSGAAVRETRPPVRHDGALDRGPGTRAISVPRRAGKAKRA